MLLDRDPQLGAFAASVADAAAGRGSVVLVEGEAGCGKTSLVRAGTADVEAWWGWCDPLSTPRPLGPLIDLAPAAGIAVDGDPFAVYDALLDALRRRRLPVAVVLEDVHWADDLTLAMVQFLGRRVADCRALVVATYRGDEVSVGLRRVLGDLARQVDHVQRIEVGALSSSAVSTLTSGSGLDPIEVMQVTNGNAFFVTELVAAGGAPSPDVTDAVLARVNGLSADVREVVELLAVEPGGLELSRVPDPERARGLLVETGHRVTFRHELARRAVYDALPSRQRRALHRQLLSELTETSVGTDLARAAHHAVGTGEPDLVMAYVKPAADDAVRRGANRQAVGFLEALLEHEADLPRADLVEALERFGVALGALDRHADAVTRLNRAVAVAEDLGDSRIQGRVLMNLADALWRAGEVALSRPTRDRAVEVLRPLGPTPELATALVLQARGRMLARHHEPALTSVSEAVAVAGEIGDEAVRVGAELIRGTVEVVTGDPDLGIELLTGVLGWARAHQDPSLEIDSLRMLSSGSGEARRYVAAYDWAQQLVNSSLSRDNDFAVGYARAWQARIRFEQGQWDEAARLVALADVEQSSPVNRATALGVLGRLRVRRGDPRALEPLLEVQRMEGLELQHRWAGLCGLAEHYWLTGDAAAGREVLQTPYLHALETDSPWAQGEIGIWLWRLGAVDRPPPKAAEPFAVQIRGDWETAASAWEAIGSPYEQALALLDGDADAAADGLLLLERLGARPAAARARRRLADQGVRVPRPPRPQTLENPWGLTERELQIHDLLLEGLDNPTIAARLYISRRTVEHHVSAVLRKRGVEGRDRLT